MSDEHKEEEKGTSLGFNENVPAINYNSMSSSCSILHEGESELVSMFPTNSQQSSSIRMNVDSNQDEMRLETKKLIVEKLISIKGNIQVGFSEENHAQVNKSNDDNYVLERY